MKPMTTPYPGILTSSETNLHAAYTRLSTCKKPQRVAAVGTLLGSLTDRETEDYRSDFRPHSHQRPPASANSGQDWLSWLILGGRGAGKTRAGAEWVRGVASADAKARIALIGETEHEVRAVMVEGVSGLLAVHPRGERPKWLPTLRRVEWKNGAVAEIFSAENHEGLRGPQFSAAWCDELAKWRQVGSEWAIVPTLPVGAPFVLLDPHPVAA